MTIKEKTQVVNGKLRSIFRPAAGVLGKTFRRNYNLKVNVDGQLVDVNTLLEQSMNKAKADLATLETEAKQFGIEPKDSFYSEAALGSKVSESDKVNILKEAIEFAKSEKEKEQKAKAVVTAPIAKAMVSPVIVSNDPHDMTAEIKAFREKLQQQQEALPKSPTIPAPTNVRVEFQEDKEQAHKQKAEALAKEYGLLTEDQRVANLQQHWVNYNKLAMVDRGLAESYRLKHSAEMGRYQIYDTSKVESTEERIARTNKGMVWKF